MTTARRNLFVARVHCVTELYGISERFTETRVFPVGMTFAQAEALSTAELRKNHTSFDYTPGCQGWHPTPRCKVSITARPSDNPEVEMGRMRPLFWQTFNPSTPLTPSWA